ncbi:hypothetical protein BDA96_01G066200 [Sorghum bicolor]|nr:hypothetical protein BDA96_01G066200 [Sorghum bicolor]KXG37399.1 hypothetical protein SORBI_3001G064200 [Sorghum bicolor]OQU90865.1 hypothetical protein SORBI_3001G064200 [Sorghum bicolor]
MLSETLTKDEVYLFGNSPKDVDALVLGHALFVLNVLPETSVLRATLQKHARLVKYAEHHLFVLLGVPSGSFSRTLPYVAYDLCVMSGQVHCEHYIDLKVYKLKYHMLVPKVVLVGLDEDGCNPLPGETEDPKSFTIASERCKKCIRTMLKGLVINEALQICFEDFTEDNIVLTETGKVKFKNVTIISCLRRGPEFKRRLHRNFKCAANIIRDLFKLITPTGIQYNIPEDILHLLNVIEREFESRSMFPVHASLVPLTQCSFFFQKMYETIRSVLSFEEFRAILDKLPYVDGWKKKVMNNALLSYPINRRPESYEVPQNKPDQRNLNKYQKGCLNDLGINPPRNQSVLSNEQEEMIKQLRLIDYWRNRTVHRMEPYRSYTKESTEEGEDAPRNAPYKAEGSELVNYVRFPMAPTYLQWELIKRREADGHVVWESFF